MCFRFSGIQKKLSKGLLDTINGWRPIFWRNMIILGLSRIFDCEKEAKLLYEIRPTCNILISSQNSIFACFKNVHNYFWPWKAFTKPLWLLLCGINCFKHNIFDTTGDFFFEFWPNRVQIWMYFFIKFTRGSFGVFSHF